MSGPKKILIALVALAAGFFAYTMYSVPDDEVNTEFRKGLIERLNGTFSEKKWIALAEQIPSTDQPGKYVLKIKYRHASALMAQLTEKKEMMEKWKKWGFEAIHFYDGEKTYTYRL